MTRQRGHVPVNAQHAVVRRLSHAVLDGLVLLVALHSVVLGVCLLFFPLTTLGLIGWEFAGQRFWPSQAGLFLLILGVAYAAALRFRPFVWLVIGSKVSAFLFLRASVVWLDAPRLVAVLGCGDGLMGVAVAIALWRVHGAERPR